MRVPVLTYHSINVAGNDYANNDHVAFATDLRTIDTLGLRIVPLQWVVDQLLGRADRDLRGCVALSCDDGSDLDYFDVEHPTWGTQRSLFNILRDSRADRAAQTQPHLHLTCFVIVSAQARAELDRTCLAGLDWWRDVWWRDAEASGLMSIASHSWDHNHPTLPYLADLGLVRGDFYAIDNAQKADYEIAQAQEYLKQQLGHLPALFCYPFSHVTPYLHDRWLPQHSTRVGLDAAFGADATPVTDDSDRWNLPRYVCGWHWNSARQLEDILGPFSP